MIWYIYNGDCYYLRAKVLAVLISSGIVFLLSVITLLYSFDFLSNQGLSFIPITSLFLISFCVVFFLIYLMKLFKLKKYLQGEIEMNNKFFKLLIYQKIINSENEQNKKKIKCKNY